MVGYFSIELFYIYNIQNKILVSNHNFLKLGAIISYAIVSLLFSSCLEKDTTEKPKAVAETIDESLISKYDGTTNKYEGNERKSFNLTNGTIATLEKTGDKTYKISFEGYGEEHPTELVAVANIKFTANKEKNMYSYTDGNVRVKLTKEGNLVVETSSPKRIKFTSSLKSYNEENIKDCSTCILIAASLLTYNVDIQISKAKGIL